MNRPIFSGRTALFAVVLLACAALLLPACSKSGRSNNTNTGAQQTGTLIPMAGSHVAIYLRDVDGEEIDTTVANAAPYSPKQTCGYCHNYGTIEEGYHFQQGADFLDDDYGVDHGMYAWVSSPGMVGKW